MIKNEWFPEDAVEKYYPSAIMIPPMKIYAPSADSSKGAKKVHELCESGNYFANIKKDGCMYIYERVKDHSYLFSRTASRVAPNLLNEKADHVPEIIKALEAVVPENTILVGEIYYHGGTSKDVSSVMNSKTDKALAKQKEKGLLHYYIHDVLEYNGESFMNVGAQKRYFKLMEIFSNKEYPEIIELAGYFDSKDYQLEDLASRMIARGEEGLVLKDKEGIYCPGKRPAWNMVKLKKHQTVDVVAIKAIPATMEYTGQDTDNWQYSMDKETGTRYMGRFGDMIKKYPNIIPVTKPYFFGMFTAMEIGAYDSEGKMVSLGTVSSGFSDEDRSQLDQYEGNVLELNVMSLSKEDLTFRHPTVLRIRSDKDAKDCLVNEIFI